MADIFFFGAVAALLIGFGLGVRAISRSTLQLALKTLAVCGLVGLLGFMLWVSAIVLNIATGGH